MTELDGRAVYTRADITARYGIPLGTQELWERDRTRTGYPNSVGTVKQGKGRPKVWDASEYDAWHDRYEQQQARPASNRAGDPDDLITLSEAARIMGVEPTSITMYPKRPPAGWPDPAEEQDLPSGRTRRRYRRGDIWDYDDTRRHPGGGRPEGSRAGQRRWPYDGDLRLTIARTMITNTPADRHASLPELLAQQHPPTSAGTWSHILAAARKHPID